MDDESTDSKKIKTEDEKIIEIGEPEPVISPKDISSKKNVCIIYYFIYSEL